MGPISWIKNEKYYHNIQNIDKNKKRMARKIEKASNTIVYYGMKTEFTTLPIYK